MEIVYASGRTEWQKGRLFGNARLFHKTVEGVEKVIVVGDWPKIVEAYRRLGIPVEIVGVTGVLRSEPLAGTGEAIQIGKGEPPCAPVMRIDAGSVEIPEDFRTLKWPELRALGKQLSDTPAINSKEALAIIEAELDRRNEQA
jgi:hypothetical protein